VSGHSHARIALRLFAFLFLTSLASASGATDGLEVDARLASGRTEYDGSVANVAEFEQLTVGGSLQRPLGPRARVRAEVGPK